MGIYKLLSTPILLCIWVLELVTMFAYARDARIDLEERKLDIAVNYSVDASIQRLVNSTENLGMDYADWERLNVDPQVAYDTYVMMFMKNWEMGDSRIATDNKMLLTTKWMPCFIVATYEGYYVYQPLETDWSSSSVEERSKYPYEVVCSIKYPYLYRNGNELWALNLGGEDAKVFNGSTITKQKLTPELESLSGLILSANLSDAMQSIVYKQLGGNTHNTVYIPDKLTKFSSTNPIEGVSVLVYMANVDIGYSTLDGCFGFAGAKIDHQEFVGCYVDKTRFPYYFYAPMSEITNEDLVQVYETGYMAAEHGWYFDNKFLD